MRENIKCPKALPRFRLRCFGASGFGSAKLRQLTLWSGTKEPGQGTSLSDFSIEAETCDIRNCGFLHSGFEHWAHLAPAFEVAFPPWNYQNLPFFCRVPIHSILGFVIRTSRKIGDATSRSYLATPSQHCGAFGVQGGGFRKLSQDESGRDRNTLH